jgi:hypothetical protein
MQEGISFKGRAIRDLLCDIDVIYLKKKFLRLIRRKGLSVISAQE